MHQHLHLNSNTGSVVSSGGGVVTGVLVCRSSSSWKPELTWRMNVQTILDAAEIGLLQKSLAKAIADDIPKGVALALVGIRSRGEILAKRLRVMLQEQFAVEVDIGVLDITLYRDDLNEPSRKQPTVKLTEIDFDVDDRLIVLVDDVLNTGRSTRAALDALIDMGRPRAIRLAVLIDRGNRELPIVADYVGKKVSIAAEERVSVYLEEMDGKEEVVVE